MAQKVKAAKDIKAEIEGATSTMTSVPKPLKFLSPHYEKMREIFDKQTDATFKVGFITPFLWVELIKLSAVDILTKFYLSHIGIICRPTFSHCNGFFGERRLQ